MAFEPSYVYTMLKNTSAAGVFSVEGRQEDAEEFLSCLLNGINDEMLEVRFSTLFLTKKENTYVSRRKTAFFQLPFIRTFAAYQVGEQRTKPGCQCGDQR